MYKISGSRRWPVAPLFAAVTLALGLSACGGESTASRADGAPVAAAVTTAPGAAAQVDAARLRNPEASQWLTYGGTYSEQRFSPLTEITPDNVGQLGLAWFADYDTNLQQEGTPLYIDGVIYVSTAWSKLYAFDARTGQQLWQYNPRVPGEWAVNVCCGLVNRGVAAWDGKIFIGTLDGRLVAVDAASGQEVWSTMTIDQNERYSITGAPRVVDGKVLIGNAGAEFGVRGYLSAYDAASGELLWRFYTVPGNPANGFENDALRMAAETWNGEWWAIGGGGTVWDAITYDPVTDLIYIGVGNGSPWSAQERSPGGGDNLFLSSIVAVRPDSGEYVWHYQTTPWETWDYTATQHIMTADVEFDGQQRHVVLQAPKNGFFYMLDAFTGQLLSANAYTEVNWADGVDLETGRPRIRPEARYDVTGEPFNALPGPQGAHAWHPMAYSPDTGLVYIPTQHAYFPFVSDPDYAPSRVGFNIGVSLNTFAYYQQNPEQPSTFNGHLLAFDPLSGREVWRSESNSAGPTGGALATAGGLVFQGSGGDREFRAFNAATGEKLWSADAQTGVLAGAISYELDGKQYVAISVGGNQAGGYFAPNYSRLLVYTLGGSAQLPPPQQVSERPLAPPPVTAAAAVAEAGKGLYDQYCAACHGNNGQTRGALFPDLTRTPLLHSQEAWDQVVLQGVREERGMVSFAEALTPSDSAALRAFLVARANELLAQMPAAAAPAPAAQDVHAQNAQ
jgi:quinohemoprotein ethanol dehydrogenase